MPFILMFFLIAGIPATALTVHTYDTLQDQKPVTEQAYPIERGK